MSEEHTDTPAEPGPAQPIPPADDSQIQIKFQIVDVGAVAKAAVMKAAAEKIEEVISSYDFDAAVKAETTRQLDAMIAAEVAGKLGPDVQAKIKALVVAMTA